MNNESNKNNIDLPDIDIRFVADVQKQDDGSFVVTGIKQILSFDLMRKDKD